MRRRAMNTSTPSSSTAPTDSSVNTASHPPGICSRCTAKYETSPEMTIAIDREGGALERDRCRGDGRRSAVVEEHDFQRLAGDAANREEADRVRGQPDPEQSRERRAGVVGKGDLPSPRAQQMPGAAGHEDQRETRARAGARRRSCRRG